MKGMKRNEHEQKEYKIKKRKYYLEKKIYVDLLAEKLTEISIEKDIHVIKYWKAPYIRIQSEIVFL